jgi:hypothetical protein
MNRTEAKRLAHLSTPADMKHMMMNAFSLHQDWTKRSTINNFLSVGVAFNIFIKCEYSEKTPMIVKINAIREFGLYHPHYVKPIKATRVLPKVYHEDPIQPSKEFYGI